MSKLTITIIAAVGMNGELGYKNDLIWNIPEDMKHFYQTTLNHTVVMGRKTYESIGQPLPKRDNIVISGDETFKHPDITVYSSVEDCINNCRKKEKIFIIGGAELYNSFMPYTNELILTEIKEEAVADRFLELPDPEDWLEVSRTSHVSKVSGIKYDIVHYVFKSF